MSLDLKIIKSITDDKIIGMDFATTYNHDLFDSEYHLFVKLLLAYTKAFRVPPTRRVLKEWAGEAYLDDINRVWDKIDSLDYNIQEFRFDLELIKNRYSERALVEIKDFIESKGSDHNRLLKDISLKIQTIKTIKQGKTFTQKTVKDYADEFEEQYKAQIDNPGKQGYILSGYSGIDFAVGGFKPSDLFLIAGATGEGKSTFLMNIAIQMFMQNNRINTPPSNFTKGANITFFSLEMPYEECFGRFISRVAGVPERAITHGLLTSDERKKILAAEKFLKTYPYEFDIVDMPRGVTTEQIELRYNDALLKYKPEVVLVDYLGLMKGGDSDQDWLKMGELAGELHEFGRVNSVIVGSAVQLNKMQPPKSANPKELSEDQKIGPHRIGRSAMILHHATLGIQIETMKSKNANYFNYHIIKNRRGPMIKAAVYTNFETCTLTDIEYVPNKKPIKEDVVSKNEQTNLKPDISDELVKIARETKLNNIKSKLHHAD
jgi:replicative DNA helicase